MYTIESLRRILDREVEEIHLTVAKANAMGLDLEVIANSVGIPHHEIAELMDSQDYKDVRLLVGSQMLTDRVERDGGWDGIENEALKKLARKTSLENDTDTLLRIAAVANRATRRTAPPKESGPLDPSQAGTRVPLTLTRRYTEKLNGDGKLVERSETQQISVLDGSAVNPKFEDVKRLLGGGLRNAIAGPDGSLNGSLIDSPARAATPRVASTSEQYIERIASAEEKPFSMDELLRAATRRKS